MSKLVLVTGGAGFVGTHLCKRLLAQGDTVISLDNYFTGSRENHVPGVEYREGHTKNIEQLVPETPDLVYHLGEYSRAEKSFDDLETVFDLNIVGTFGVVEFCRKKNMKLVYAGSSTKFADGGLGRDQSPYAFSKAKNTELIRNYGAWFNMPFAITYFYNVYGPGERAGAYGTVVEIFLQKFSRGEKLQVNEPGTQKRNFTHVDDIVDGLLLVGEKGEGDEFGLGNQRSYTVLELAELIGGTVELVPSPQGNRMNAEIDTSKSTLLGWHPTHELVDYILERKAKV